MGTNNIKRTLVFHFYAENNYLNNRAIQIHLKCLKYYSYVFDEAVFCIALDDANNKKLFNDVQANISECGFKDIRFKLVSNTIYREALTFYNEVVNTEREGIVFFGHTKGYTNYINMPHCATIESLDTWITGLYYLSLNFVSDAESFLVGRPIGCFYGSFLSYCKEIEMILYSGAFFWTNMLNIKKYHHSLPLLNDLTYAEDFLNRILSKDEFAQHRGFSGTNNFMSYELNYYYYADEQIRYFFDENSNEYEDFCIFKNNIITGL